MEAVAKKKKLYEGLFLVDSADANADWDGIITFVKTILDKAEAEVVSLRKWDDRKLAYDIAGKSRGVYILCYFKAEGGKIRDIEKDVQLSEKIMRVLILNAEQMTQADMEKDTPAIKAEKEKEKGALPAAAGSSEQSNEEQTDETDYVGQADQAERLTPSANPQTTNEIDSDDYRQETSVDQA